MKYENKNKKIVIKNMVCSRCIKVVKEGLVKLDIDFVDIRLGEVILKKNLNEDRKESFKKYLKEQGFEWVEGREKTLINAIKSLIIKYINSGEMHKPGNKNLSDFLSGQLNLDYSYLSRIFSEMENKTIEKYAIEQKIEKVKEMIIYDELTLSEISYELDYSSPQHLSRQFKQVTGMTPTQFKKIRKKKFYKT